MPRYTLDNLMQHRQAAHEARVPSVYTKALARYLLARLDAQDKEFMATLRYVRPVTPL